MLLFLLRSLARLPLRCLHLGGVAIGWLVYCVSSRYARRIKENLISSGICSSPTDYRRLLRAVVAQQGRAITELAAVWFRPANASLRFVVDCRGWQVVECAHRIGRSIIFLSPHMGCFEIAALYVGAKLPLTVLYRPQRAKWLDMLIQRGRRRQQIQLAPAGFAGVRMLRTALGRGEAVGLLPDHAPGIGQGVWADFFGRPALTMTLARKLQQISGAALIMTFAERLACGKGFRLHFEALSIDGFDEAKLNLAIENLVRRFPEQYFWGYNRYKGVSSRRRRQTFVSRRKRK